LRPGYCPSFSFSSGFDTVSRSGDVEAFSAADSLSSTSTSEGRIGQQKLLVCCALLPVVAPLRRLLCLKPVLSVTRLQLTCGGFVDPDGSGESVAQA